MSVQEEQIINDATDKVKGFLYQFYTALKYCFELMPGEKLYIEKYGDITISQLKQIEVKNYSKPLTDTQENFWNTLNNYFIKFPNRAYSFYFSLVYYVCNYCVSKSFLAVVVQNPF